MASLINRYSVALFEVARDQNCIDQVDGDLAVLAQALDAPNLRLLLEDPQVDKSQRVRALHALLASGEREASPLTLRFVELLIQKGRQGILAAVARAFHVQALTAKGIIEGTLHTALPIAEEDKAALESALGRKLGSRVQLNTVVDESLLGGFRVLVGDSMFDSSLRGQIEALSRKLKAVSVGGASQGESGNAS